MTSFKRWFGAGAIVLVALALIACPSMVPTVANEIGDMEFGAGDIGKTKTVSSLGGYFNVRNDATYDASSSDDTVVTASVADTTLTVTAKGSGTANVTVTAKDRDGTVAQTFSVTVAAVVVPPVVVPPVVVPPSNDPPLSKTIPDASLQVGDTKMLTLSRYFTDREGDSLTYSAVSDKPAIAAVTVPDADSMIMITAVAAGKAMITVTADDSTNDAVGQTFYVTVTEVTEDPPPNERPTSMRIPDVPLRVGGMATVILSNSYRDQDGDELMYTAQSRDPMIATVTEPDADSMITITAVGVGEAMINVTASDGKSTPVPETFMVTVKATINAPPSPRTGITTDVSLVVEGMTNLKLSNYFTDAEGDSLTYTADSSDDAIATVTEPAADSMIMITAVAAGEAKITVTASDGAMNDGVMNPAVSLVFTVTVSTTTPPANEPPMGTRIADVPLQVEGTKTLTLSMYFTDAEGDSLTYSAVSDKTAIATVTVPDAASMIMITAVAAGEAKITVTASDGAMNDGVMNPAVPLVFTVTVSAAPAAPNMPPFVKMRLPDLKRAIDPDIDDAMADFTINLGKHFEDPESTPTLYYKAEVVTQTPDDAVKIVAVGTSMSVPDGTDFDKILGISLIEPGSAEIKVTATDAGGLSVSDSFMITIGGENSAPTRGSSSIDDQNQEAAQTNNKRLKIGETREVITDELFSAYFVDTDRGPGSSELLTFEVKLYPLDTNDDTVGTAKEIESGKAGVTAVISPNAWGGTSDTAEFTLSLTGVLGTTGQEVALIATDQYGGMGIQWFSVRVNHDPVNEGSQAEPKKLSTENGYRGENGLGLDIDKQVMTMDDHVSVVDLIDYFSDKDGVDDITECRILGKTGTAAKFKAEGVGASIKLRILPTEIGTSTVTVQCLDRFDRKSDSDALTVEVNYYSGEASQH